MFRAIIKIDPLFVNSRVFPWDVLGIWTPKVGPVHSYLCVILAEFGDHDEQVFLRGKPAMFELERFAKKTDSLSNSIFSYCESIYKKPQSERKNTADEVLGFLQTNQDFRKKIQKRLDILFLEGLALFPEECIPVEWRKYAGRKEDFYLL
jgi:hypothetical protein